MNDHHPLPSERSFGFLFTIVFVLAGSYAFYTSLSPVAVGVWFVLAALTLVLTLVAPHVLAPLNRLWFALGMLLGKIVSPIVLGLIFFLMITPVAVFTRLFGRDALKLRKPGLDSFWVERKPTGPDPDTFKNQF